MVVVFGLLADVVIWFTFMSRTWCSRDCEEIMAKFRQVARIRQNIPASRRNPTKQQIRQRTEKVVLEVFLPNSSRSFRFSKICHFREVSIYGDFPFLETFYLWKPILGALSDLWCEVV